MSPIGQAWQAMEEDLRSRLLATPEAEGGGLLDLYDANTCPRCQTYTCAGVRVPECSHWVTILACCQMGEHSYCADWWCAFAEHWRAKVVSAGLALATASR